MQSCIVFIAHDVLTFAVLNNCRFMEYDASYTFKARLAKLEIQ